MSADHQRKPAGAWVKRYSFSTFLVDDLNREAHQLCLAVAELRPVFPQPLVILGDKGSGKTHLLYSIVNRVRAGSAKAGLAYVTAYDFPDQVRALIEDPSPVQRAQKAILLVDQLDEFTDFAKELEAVVRIFLQCNHYVLLGSSIHPGRLQHLPPGLRQMIAEGQIVEIKGQSAETQLELIRRQVRAESEAELLRQRKEIQELRQLVQAVKAQTPAEETRPPELAALVPGAPAAGSPPVSERGQASEALWSVEAENDQLRLQVESLERGTERLREQLESAEQGRLRAENLLQQADSNRTRFAKAEQEQRQQLQELEVLREERSAATAKVERAEARVKELQDELARTIAARETASTEAEELRTRLENAYGECKGLRDTLEDGRRQTEELQTRLDSTLGEQNKLSLGLREASYTHDALRAELDQTRKELADLRKEMESLRREAAAQVAEASAHAGELEGKMSRLWSQVNHAREKSGSVRGEMRRLMEHLSGMIGTLSALADRLAETELGLAAEPEWTPPRPEVPPDELGTDEEEQDLRAELPRLDTEECGLAEMAWPENIEVMPEPGRMASSGANAELPPTNNGPQGRAD